MNSLTIIGNVTKDSELRTTQSGVDICTFTVAVNDKYNKDKPPLFFRVTAWRKLAEVCGKFITKGMKVCVVGAIENPEYTDKEGNKRYSLNVTANDVEFLSRVGEANSHQEEQPQPQEESQFTDVSAEMFGELPF